MFALAMHNGKGNSIIYYNILPEPIMTNTHYVPVIGKGLWKLQLKGFKANKDDYSYYANNTVILDSGADRIQLNTDLLNILKD